MFYCFYLVHNANIYSVVIIINISIITSKLYNLFYSKITHTTVVDAVGVHFVYTRQGVAHTENIVPP